MEITNGGEATFGLLQANMGFLMKLKFRKSGKTEEWCQFSDHITSRYTDRMKEGRKRTRLKQGEITARLCVWSEDLQACYILSASFLCSKHNFLSKERSLHNKGNVCLCLCMSAMEWSVLQCKKKKASWHCCIFIVAFIFLTVGTLWYRICITPVCAFWLPYCLKKKKKMWPRQITIIYKDIENF